MGRAQGAVKDHFTAVLGDRRGLSRTHRRQKRTALARHIGPVLPENRDLEPAVLIPLSHWFENADPLEVRVLHDIVLDHIIRKGSPTVALSLKNAPGIVPAPIRAVLRDAVTEYLNDDSLSSLGFKRSQLDVLTNDLSCLTPGTASRDREDMSADVPLIEAIAGIYRRKPGNYIYLAKSLASQPVGHLSFFESWTQAILTFLKEEEHSRELIHEVRQALYSRSIPEPPQRTTAFREIREAVDALKP